MQGKCHQKNILALNAEFNCAFCNVKMRLLPLLKIALLESIHGFSTNMVILLTCVCLRLQARFALFSCEFATAALPEWRGPAERKLLHANGRRAEPLAHNLIHLAANIAWFYT